MAWGQLNMGMTPLPKEVWYVNAPEPSSGTARPQSPQPFDSEDIASSRSLNKLWKFQAQLQVLGLIDQQLPYTMHAISVSVVGGPKADLTRVWHLALATAFGRYRQAGQEGVQTGRLSAVWDITGKAVKVDLITVNSGIVGTALNLRNMVFGGGPGDPNQGQARGGERNREDFLLFGATQETVGADKIAWMQADGTLVAAGAGAAIGNVLGRVIGGRAIGNQTAGRIGAGVGAALSGYIYSGIKQYTESLKANVLPDTGRIITTANKLNPNLQPPKPSGDGLSRTFPFISLVSNALTEPCYLPTRPPIPSSTKPKPVFISTSKVTNRMTINRVVNGYAVNIPVEPDAVAAVAGGGVIGALVNQTTLGSRNDGYPSLPKQVDNIQGPPTDGN